MRDIFKWVDNVVLFRSPTTTYLDVDGLHNHIYGYDLNTVFRITDPLGVPWHPIQLKGQDFRYTVAYVGFLWNLVDHCISLLEKKWTKLLVKIDLFLEVAKETVTQKDCSSLHGSLQHITFIYREGCSTLPAPSSFLCKFPNNFAKHHVPRSVIDCVLWWKSILV